MYHPHHINGAAGLCPFASAVAVHGCSGWYSLLVNWKVGVMSSPTKAALLFTGIHVCVYWYWQQRVLHCHHCSCWKMESQKFIGWARNWRISYRLHLFWYVETSRLECGSWEAYSIRSTVPLLHGELLAMQMPLILLLAQVYPHWKSCQPSNSECLRLCLVMPSWDDHRVQIVLSFMPH